MKQYILQTITMKFDQIIAFVSGDLLVTCITLQSLPELDWLHPILKIVAALFVGIFGGIGGLIGKDLYTWIKKKFK